MGHKDSDALIPLFTNQSENWLIPDDTNTLPFRHYAQEAAFSSAIYIAFTAS